MEIMALSGCSPLGSYTIISSPKSQKSWLEDKSSTMHMSTHLKVGNYFENSEANKGQRALPKQTTSVGDNQLYSFAVAELAQMLLLIQRGVSQHYHLGHEQTVLKTLVNSWEG